MPDDCNVHVGNVRVSKADGSQVTDLLQRDALRAAGVEPRHVYEDTTSGKRDDRPGLAACLKAVREGDTLVVWKLDRLGRDLRPWSTRCTTWASRSRRTRNVVKARLAENIRFRPPDGQLQKPLEFQRLRKVPLGGFLARGTDRAEPSLLVRLAIIRTEWPVSLGILAVVNP